MLKALMFILIAQGVHHDPIYLETPSLWSPDLVSLSNGRVFHRADNLARSFRPPLGPHFA